MIREAKAAWRGTGRAGSGHLCTDFGVLEETPYFFSTRFEDEKGTNPAELIAAAPAGCFAMAPAFGLPVGGDMPTKLTTEARVTFEQTGPRFPRQSVGSDAVRRGAKPGRSHVSSEVGNG
jgi:lipoyl-dependent peroxiredoxin